MTIKEFAALCSCNPQTLRYYDRIGLLKPSRVDAWTGYRFYEKQQALDFIKIKNLQEADFSIEEIKELLTKSDDEVYDAFQKKITEQESKLARMKQIQKSYLEEKDNMDKLIKGMADCIVKQVSDGEVLKEFGLSAGDGEEITEDITKYFELFFSRSDNADETASKDFKNDCESEEAAAVEETFFESAEYETVFEKHNWHHVKEFIDEIPALEEGKEYSLYFQLEDNKENMEASFPMVMLGVMLRKNEGKKLCIGCNAEKSSDESNHFYLKVSAFNH